MVLLGNLLKLSAGIGLFLFAMYLIEESLKNLSGRNFKLFLQNSYIINFKNISFNFISYFSKLIIN